MSHSYQDTPRNSKLLEYGLLSAAQGVDDLHLARYTYRAAEREGEKAKTYQRRRKRLTLSRMMNSFLGWRHMFHLQLSRASSSKRDDYKDALVYQARKDLIKRIFEEHNIEQMSKQRLFIVRTFLLAPHLF